MKNRITLLVCAAVAALGFGCGGIAEDASVEQSAPDIGQAEQPINIGNGGYGLSTAQTQGRCAQPGLSGQVCFSWAPVAVVTYCFSGFTAADQADILSGIESVDSQNGIAFNNSAFPCDINIQNGAVANGQANCGNSRCVETLMKFIPTGTLTPLTSPAGASHVNGTWTSFTRSSVVIDVAQLGLLETPGFHSSQMARFGQHIAALHLGLGAQNSTATRNLGSDRATFTLGSTWFNFGLSAGEVCRVNGMSAGVPGQISAVFGCAVN